MPSRPANAMSRSSPPKPATRTMRLLGTRAAVRLSEKDGWLPSIPRRSDSIMLGIMNSIEFTAALLAVAAAAGFLGSLTGLGGGVVITPVLTLLFGIDLRYAIGASLVSAIAT